MPRCYAPISREDQLPRIFNPLPDLDACCVRLSSLSTAAQGSTRMVNCRTGSPIPHRRARPVSGCRSASPAHRTRPAQPKPGLSRCASSRCAEGSVHVGIRLRRLARRRWSPPADPPTRRLLGRQLIVASPEVLDEAVSGDDHPCTAVLLESSHCSQPRLEAANGQNSWLPAKESTEIASLGGRSPSNRPVGCSGQGRFGPTARPC
jgi:hypothetical protein